MFHSEIDKENFSNWKCYPMGAYKNLNCEFTQIDFLPTPRGLQPVSTFLSFIINLEIGSMYLAAIFKEIGYWHHLYEYPCMYIEHFNCYHESINSYESYACKSLKYVNASNPPMLFMYRDISV